MYETDATALRATALLLLIPIDLHGLVIAERALQNPVLEVRRGAVLGLRRTASPRHAARP